MRAIAVTAFKGGVGKTTVTANLGAALAERGHRVAVVDLEPTANLSLMFGYGRADVEELGRSSVEVLRGECSFDEAAVGIEEISDQRTSKSVRENLKIVPSKVELQDVNNELILKPRGEEALARAVRASTNFDYVLFDCQPGGSYMTINAIVAAGNILVPIKVHEQVSIEGLAQVAELAQGLEDLGIPARITGILRTHVDHRDRAYKDNAEQLVGIDTLYDAEIPAQKKIVNIQNDRPFFIAKPNDLTSDLYREVAIETERRLEAQS